MAMTRAALTDGDIRMLVKGPTADDRAEAAHKLCRRIGRDDLTAAESVNRVDLHRRFARGGGRRRDCR